MNCQKHIYVIALILIINMTMFVISVAQEERQQKDKSKNTYQTDLKSLGDGAFPKWSPDGKLIAFTREVADENDQERIGYEIFTMTPDGENRVCLTCGKSELTNAGWRGQPYWHPSGRYIVFTAESRKYPRKGLGVTARPGLGRNHNVWIMTSDGNNFWQMTDYPDNWGVIRPSFSHDGQVLYWNEEFSMEKYPQGKEGDIKLPGDPADSMGHPGSYWGHASKQYRIGEELCAWRVKIADISFLEGQPEIANARSIDPPEGFTLIEGTGFLPDDSGFVYSYANLEENKGRGYWGDIYVSDLEGRLTKRLTETPFIHDENPEFSPDGTKVIWNKAGGDPGEGEELWLMNTMGNNKKRLTYFTAPDAEEYDEEARQITESDWSPDQRQIVFGQVSQKERGGPHIPSKIYLLTFN